MRSLTQKTKIWWHNAVSRRFGKYSFVHDFLEDPNLRMLSDENTDKFQIVEWNGEFNYTKITNSAENGDLTCKKIQFELKEDDSYIIFHVYQVLSTTNLDLKPFVGKALVQRVEENYEVVRETDDVIHLMDAWLPLIKHKRRQLESQPKEWFVGQRIFIELPNCTIFVFYTFWYAINMSLLLTLYHLCFLKIQKKLKFQHIW